MPKVVELLDLTSSFDFDQILISKFVNSELRDQTCLVAMALIGHKKGLSFESVTSNPMFLLQNLVRILYTSMESLINFKFEFNSIKREMADVRKQVKRWS